MWTFETCWRRDVCLDALYRTSATFIAAGIFYKRFYSAAASLAPRTAAAPAAARHLDDNAFRAGCACLRAYLLAALQQHDTTYA